MAEDPETAAGAAIGGAFTDLDRLLAQRSASSASFSKDGKTLYHLSDESGMPQVWALDLAGGGRRRLTDEAEKIGFFSRSPRDDRLVYGVDRGGDERQQLKLLIPGEAPATLTAAPGVIHNWGAWSPDGAAVAYAANARDEAHFDIQIMDLASRRTRLVEHGRGINSVLGWSPRGTRLALIEERASFDCELRLFDLALNESRRVPAAAPARYQGVRWRPDGSGFLIATDDGREWLGVAEIDATSLERRWVHAPARDVELLAFAADASLLAVVENIEGASALSIRDPAQGRETARAEVPDGSRILDLAWAPDGTSLALTIGGFARPCDIWLWRIGERAMTRLTDGGGPAPEELVEPERVSYPSFDGRAIPAFLFLPRSAPPPGGHRAVVWVHGGPEGQARPQPRPDLQLLLARGFAVLVPNVRGSSGYGRTWMALDDVERRMDSVRDLRHAALWLGARPDIDAKRIGVMGQSYGGFMVLAALTEDPELWAAGVEHYGFCNFLTLLATTGAWRRGHRAREYGDPLRDARFLAEVSPVNKAERLRAPLLVTHGDRDPRVPRSESEQLIARLRALGKKVEYLPLDHAGHGYVLPAHRRAVFEALADFFDRHV